MTISTSDSKQIWRNLALHHLLTNGSCVVNGCRQNTWQLKKIYIYTTRNPHDSNLSINILWNEKLCISLEKAILWIEDLHFSQKQPFEVKNILMDLFLTNTQLFAYCNVFISCLDFDSDGTHSPQMIHWWASDVMLNFSKSAPVQKTTHLNLGWPEAEYIFSKFSFLGEPFL